MALVKTVVSLESSTGLPENRTVNTLWFNSGLPLVGSLADALRDILASFFNDAPAGQNAPIAARISNAVTRAIPVSVRMYEGATPNAIAGSPTFTRTFVLGNSSSISPGNIAMPREVSLCLSYHADLTNIQEEVGATHPAARRRGRIYLGPLNMGASDVTDGAANGGLRPGGSFIGDVAFAAGRLHDAAAVAAGFTWVVASRADNTARTVTGGFVDNEFDTQRRRGLAFTARTQII